MLGLQPDVAVQAFVFGDGFTNLISPVLAWTVGSCAMVKVPFHKWVKWVFPKVLILLGIGCVIIFFLVAVGWTGAW